MRFCSIASGSSGNCIFAGSGSASVLIDTGLSGKRIEKGLNGIDMTTSDIDGILITHEHSDHIKGLGVLARRYEIPIYATGGTIDAIKNMDNIGKIPPDLFREIEEGKRFNIKDLTIDSFDISHDAAHPVGFVIETEGSKACIATDMGIYDDKTVEMLSGSDILLVEANHDIRMLQTGRYPYYLKRRIMGEKGHLSNETAGRLVCSVLHDDIKHILLGHLSMENNYEELAFEAVCQEITLGECAYKAGDFDISIAKRQESSRLFEI